MLQDAHRRAHQTTTRPSGQVDEIRVFAARSAGGVVDATTTTYATLHYPTVTSLSGAGRRTRLRLIRPNPHAPECLSSQLELGRSAWLTSCCPHQIIPAVFRSHGWARMRTTNMQPQMLDLRRRGAEAHREGRTKAFLSTSHAAWLHNLETTTATWTWLSFERDIPTVEAVAGQKSGLRTGQDRTRGGMYIPLTKDQRQTRPGREGNGINQTKYRIPTPIAVQTSIALHPGPGRKLQIQSSRRTRYFDKPSLPRPSCIRMGFSPRLTSPGLTSAVCVFRAPLLLLLWGLGQRCLLSRLRLYWGLDAA
ncbi:hypothetical protein CMUS01_02342 [Colletotrichum musicola]|uniref:Uncharacterized protein n=1 Tax=Colletotrichum musicola TaxID=2175873 RepID=A0A8H6NVD5_9PEZI|nr:hypothetical protein CMUS01_02342 [Colletotrichum musicola]